MGNRFTVCIFAAVVAVLSITPGPAVAEDSGAKNSLNKQESEAGWRLLFDGETLQGWRGYHGLELPEGWSAEDGVLHFSGGRGDLLTIEEFSNFEVSMDWRVSDEGNSGIFYLAELGHEQIYMSAPEMQVLDDARHRDGGDPLTSAGANYGLYPAPRGVVRPAGEWNEVRIRIENEHVEHWLNGQIIVEYVIGSPQWQELVAQSKFSDWPEYGMARSGHIGLQDHGDEVWFRDIKIRILE
jgi:hypothetical protein